jgi:hypothetical protein
MYKGTKFVWLTTHEFLFDLSIYLDLLVVRYMQGNVFFKKYFFRALLQNQTRHKRDTNLHTYTADEEMCFFFLFMMSCFRVQQKSAFFLFKALSQRLGSVLWLQFSAIFANFWRKNWSFSQKRQFIAFFRRKYLKNHNIGPGSSAWRNVGILSLSWSSC